MTQQNAVEPQVFRPLRVLVCAFACGPDWGSEVGMGWHWVCELARHCELDVIVEAGFRESIEAAADIAFTVGYRPKFHYVDIGSTGRREFWNQGDWRFYLHYRGWQRKVETLAARLLDETHFDVVHQLNLVGFREPGRLWRLPGGIAYVWGPICGMSLDPWKFLGRLPAFQRWKYRLKNFINLFQRTVSLNVKHALSRADAVAVVTPVEELVAHKFCRGEVRIIPEVGAAPSASAAPRHPGSDGDTRLKLVWNGVMEGRKGLDILLTALSGPKLAAADLELHIIGDGPCGGVWHRLAAALGVERRCVWHGRIPHADAIKIMAASDLCVFTSWKEATSTVINEALSLGVPVLCHDACGMSAAITPDCGVKVPLRDFETSVADFAAAISELAGDREKLAALSAGALERAHRLSWSALSLQMLDLYRAAIQMNRRAAERK